VSTPYQDDTHEYISVAMREDKKDAIQFMRKLYKNEELSKNDIRNLGLDGGWTFYFRFGDSFEFMLKKIKA
jgi:hypothetical protein